MLVEGAALAVGKKLAERAGLLWLRYKAAATDRDKDLVELIQIRFGDQIIRRRVERQLDDIADSVLGRLRGLCGHEYAGLAENDKQAVLAAVQRTLETADLSDEALFSDDVDPVKLAARLRKRLSKGRRERELGDAGARLYEVLLDECCDCLVRIVSELPQFQHRASAETLARLSDLGSQVGDVLSRLPERTLDAPAGTTEDEGFRRRYLEHVSQKLDSLELLGLRFESFTPRTTVSVSYISLTVSAEDDPAGVLSRRAVRGTPELPVAAWREAGLSPERASMQVETALARSRLTLIRGEAGGGKTTLLKWLTVTAARGGFTADLADWNGCVPFFVKLQSYADEQLPRPEEFLDGAASPVVGLMPPAWVHRQLRYGRALLLVDGVDELMGPRRRQVREWLRGLLVEYPKIRVVVTSRPAAAESRWLADEGFASVFLERMTPEGIRALAQHWHRAVRNARDLPCVPEKLPGYEKKLLAQLETAPHLSVLASTPLLAAMLCALNLDRKTQLPHDRMELYAATLEMLLVRRDAERDIPSEITLEYKQQIRILQELAMRLTSTGRVELPKSTALRRVEDALLGLPQVSASAEEVLDYLLQRSGVLREPVPNRVDFIHRTVLEYLAAKQLADDGDVEPLVQNATRAQWRETIIMAAGHANAPLRKELLEGLLDRIEDEPQKARRFRLLVVACLETLQQVPNELREKIEDCWRHLVPPPDFDAARALAEAGEQVLDRLPESLDGLSIPDAAATVCTARLVNGPRALSTLARYGTDSRKRVQDELIKGWEYFDPGEYAQQVLSSTPFPYGRLRLGNPTLLRSVRHLTHMTKLGVILRDSADLSVLHGVPRLVSMTAFNLGSVDISALIEHASTLTHVNLQWPGPLGDISPLSLLPQLRSLFLSAQSIADLSFVCDLPLLDELHLSGTDTVEDFTPLKRYTALKRLGVTRCPNLTNLEMLPFLGDLTTLCLDGSRLINELSQLVAMAPKVRALSLRGCSWVNDLRPLTALRLSDRLYLSDCAGVTDLAPLHGQSHLRCLDLERATNIEDLSPLSGLTNLRKLWLGNCHRIQNLEPLEPLRKLHELRVEGIAPGTDLAPLARNSRLTVYIYDDQEVRNGELLGRRLRRRPRPDVSAES